MAQTSRFGLSLSLRQGTHSQRHGSSDATSDATVPTPHWVSIALLLRHPSHSQSGWGDANAAQYKPNGATPQHDGAARWLLRRWDCVPSLTPLHTVSRTLDPPLQPICLSIITQGSNSILLGRRVAQRLNAEELRSGGSRKRGYQLKMAHLRVSIRPQGESGSRGQGQGPGVGLRPVSTPDTTRVVCTVYDMGFSH